MAVLTSSLSYRTWWNPPRVLTGKAGKDHLVYRKDERPVLYPYQCSTGLFLMKNPRLSARKPRMFILGFFTVLYDWYKSWVSRVAFFANRNSAAKAKGVPTEDLIRRFQGGQPRAFEAIYDRFKDYVYRTALFVTKNGDEAEEATQETFLDVLRALPNYRVDGPARFETWLYRVTVNRCRSRMRRKTLPTEEWNDIEDRLERIPEPHPDNPEDAVVRQERATVLWQAVDGLSESHRLVVMLRYQQGFSYDEIAQTLGISTGTVKSRLYNAHRKLKEQL